MVGKGGMRAKQKSEERSGPPRVPLTCVVKAGSPSQSVELPLLNQFPAFKKKKIEGEKPVPRGEADQSMLKMGPQASWAPLLPRHLSLFRLHPPCLSPQPLPSTWLRNTGTLGHLQGVVV